MWTLIILLLSLLLLLSMMRFITGFTCPPTICFKFITKCDKYYYKVRQLFYYKVRQVLLQSTTGITKCDNFITKCDDYYKVQQYTSTHGYPTIWTREADDSHELTNQLTSCGHFEPRLSLLVSSCKRFRPRSQDESHSHRYSWSNNHSSN